MKKILGVALLLQVSLLASSCQEITRNLDFSNSYNSNNNISKSNSVKKKAINVPNDPGFEKQWAFELHNAHSIPKGKGVVIAVVDKFPENNFGIDFSETNIHPKSKNVQSEKRLATKKDFDKLPKNNGSLKHNIHGFIVFAILVQSTNNKIGTASIVPEAQVMILDISNDNNAENFNAAKVTAKAIRDAVDNGADIINLSMASNISDEDVKYALDHAFNENVLVVVAAGNDKGKNTSYLAKQSDGKIVVESVNRQGKKSSFSDDGELAAAGGEHEGCIEVNDENTNPLGIVQTLSILDDDDFEDKLISCSGTSMAAPYVAGGAASVIEVLKPAGIQSPLIVEEILKFTAREKGDNAGILDARKAVELANQLVDKKSAISNEEEKLVSLIIEKAYRLMKNALKEEDSHTLQSVLTLFNDINIFAPNQLSISEWNKVCWFGSLLAGMQDKTKHIENLSSACEKVVTNEQDPNYYYFLDTKAVFMALKGDFTQAEKHFEEVYRASSSKKIYYNEDREKEYEKRLTLLQNNQLAQRKNILLDFFNQSNWKCYVTYENKDIPSECKNNSVQVSTLKKY